MTGCPTGWLRAFVSTSLITCYATALNVAAPPLRPTCPSRLLLEVGAAACLARLAPALDSLTAFLQEGLAGPQALLGGGVPLSPLKARILQMATASPLVRWALQQPQQDQKQQEQGQGQGQATPVQDLQAQLLARQLPAGSPQGQVLQGQGSGGSASPEDGPQATAHCGSSYGRYASSSWN